MLRSVLEREEKERRDKLVHLNLEPVQSISVDDMEKMSSGEKSRMRRAIFKNHEITASRAYATAEHAKKVQDDIKENQDIVKGIKDEYEAKMNEINNGFVSQLIQI